MNSFRLNHPWILSDTAYIDCSVWDISYCWHGNTIGLPFKRSVLQLSPASYPQNRSSLPKSVLAEFHGLGTYEEFMETDGNSTRQCETVIEAAKNHFRPGVVDTALRHLTNNSLFKTVWISHEFWVHGIQLVLLSEVRVSFYFAESKGHYTAHLSYWPLHLIY